MRLAALVVACAALVFTRNVSFYTHNTFFLPPIARVFVAAREEIQLDEYRMDSILDPVRRLQPDVVCLQELFNNNAKDKIMKKLENYNYSVIREFNPSGYILTNSGLSFASKLEILEWSFHEYTIADKATSDFLAAKGVGYVLLKVPEAINYSVDINETRPNYICVFCTHLQAEVDSYTIREEQLRQFYKYLRYKVTLLEDRMLLKYTSIYLMGDFNINGMNNDVEYEILVKTLSNPLDSYRVFNARADDSVEDEFLLSHQLNYTFDLDSEGSTNEGQRLDYIFFYSARIGLHCATPTLSHYEKIPRWNITDQNKTQTKFYVSDHDALLTRFSLP